MPTQDQMEEEIKQYAEGDREEEGQGSVCPAKVGFLHLFIHQEIFWKSKQDDPAYLQNVSTGGNHQGKFWKYLIHKKLSSRNVCAKSS